MNKIDFLKFREYSKLEKYKKKLYNTQKNIEKTLLEFSNPYVSYSTGKDSLTLLMLCKKIKEDISIMFHDSGLELPESYLIIQKLLQEGYKIDVVKSPIDILENFQKHNTFEIGGYDSDKAFNEAMKKPIIKYQEENKKDIAIIGIRALESKIRRMMIGKYGNLFFAKTWNIYHFFPLAYWTVFDIFAYITSNDLLDLLHPAYSKTNFDEIEKIRISWYCDPTVLTHGNITWLKYYYPELFNKLCKISPEIKNYI